MTSIRLCYFLEQRLGLWNCRTTKGNQLPYWAWQEETKLTTSVGFDWHNWHIECYFLAYVQSWLSSRGYMTRHVYSSHLKVKQDLSLAGRFSLRKADVVNFALNARYSCQFICPSNSQTLYLPTILSLHLYLCLFSLSCYPSVWRFVLEVESIMLLPFRASGKIFAFNRRTEAFLKKSNLKTSLKTTV